jgi:hypothetical protein
MINQWTPLSQKIILGKFQNYPSIFRGRHAEKIRVAPTELSYYNIK